MLQVIIDAPPVNAISMPRYHKLTEIFQSMADRKDVHCVLLSATGRKAFSAGLDLKEFASWPKDRDHERSEAARGLFEAIRKCAVPVVCAINGPALGTGAVIAACCDIRIASSRASIGMPEINVGRCGGGSHIGRLVSQGMLRMMYFTGEPITAHEALQAGLVQQVVADRLLMQTAMEVAQLISMKSPLGLRMAKRALDESEYLQVEAGYALEQQYSERLSKTDDGREAIAAAAEKRQPIFRGS